MGLTSPTKHNPELKKALQQLEKAHLAAYRKKTMKKEADSAVREVASALSELARGLKGPWCLEASDEDTLQPEKIRNQLQSVLNAKYWAGSYLVDEKGNAAMLLGRLAAQRVTSDGTRKEIETSLFRLLKIRADADLRQSSSERHEEAKRIYLGALAGIRDMASVGKLSGSGFKELKKEYTRLSTRGALNRGLRDEVVTTIGGIRPKSEEVRGFLIELSKKRPGRDSYLRATAVRGLEDWADPLNQRAFETLFALAENKREDAGVRRAALISLLGGYDPFERRQGKPEAAMKNPLVVKLLIDIGKESSTSNAQSELIAIASTAYLYANQATRTPAYDLRPHVAEGERKTHE